MGFFEKLRRNVPGGPTSIAKKMLNVYRSYVARDPGEKSIRRIKVLYRE